jgi:hypothetical protein
MTRADTIRATARAYLRAKAERENALMLLHSPCHDYDRFAYQSNADSVWDCVDDEGIACAALESAVYVPGCTDFTMTLDGHVFGFRDGILAFSSAIHAAL